MTRRNTLSNSYPGRRGMRAKTTADILWLAQLILYYSNGMNLLKGRGTNISAVHRRRSDFESGGAQCPPLLPCALLHGWARAS